MDQVKIGQFLKDLRKEKEITQEQLAEKCNKRVRLCNAIGMLLVLVSMLLKDSDIYMNNDMVYLLVDVAQGMAIGMLLTGLIFSSRYGAKIRAFKKRIMNRI